MHLRPIRYRRAQRSDCDAIFALLNAAGFAANAERRADRSRFRRIVADLGGDLYVATMDEHLVGVVHLTYARHLVEGQRATLELLLVTPDARGRGVGRGLAALAAARARARRCRWLTHGDGGLDEPGRAFLARLGWRPMGEQWCFEVSTQLE
ncbi:MAG: GNAT family N-acetyltransferase [Candidatus Binatia bacterium]